MKKRYVVKYQDSGRWYIYDKLLKAYIKGKDGQPLILFRGGAWAHARVLNNAQITKTLEASKRTFKKIVEGRHINVE